MTQLMKHQPIFSKVISITPNSGLTLIFVNWTGWDLNPRYCLSSTRFIRPTKLTALPYVWFYLVNGDQMVNMLV